MESSVLKAHELKKKRAIRVRKKLRGTATKPRLCVVKSNLHLEAQMIDDQNGKTLFGISTRNKDLRKNGQGKKSKETAKLMGEMIADAAKQQNIETLVFDRGHSKYHGVLAALADAIREKGLKV